MRHIIWLIGLTILLATYLITALYFLNMAVSAGFIKGL